MLELGKDSIKLHRSVGEYLQKQGVDALFAIGEGGVEIAQGAVEAGMNPANVSLFIDRDNIENITKGLTSYIQKGDTLLFKASRGVRLERVVNALREL